MKGKKMKTRKNSWQKMILKNVIKGNIVFYKKNKLKKAKTTNNLHKSSQI